MQIQSLLERLRPYGNGTRSAESTSPAHACTAEDLKQWVYTNAAQSQADHWLHSTCNLAAYKPHLFAVIAELSQFMPLHTNEELRLGPALFQGGLGHSQTTGMPKLIFNNGKVQVLEHDKAILELLAALLNTETKAFRMQIKEDLESGRDLGCAQVDRLVQKLKSESRCTTINSKANAYALNNESVRYISQSQNQRSNNPTSEQALKYLIQNLLTIKRIGHESETENLPLVDIYRGDTEDFSQGSESIFNRIACNDPQQFDQGKHLHFDTFLPSVARTFEYLNDRDAQDGDCHWAVKLEGCWVPISDINQVVDYVISTARGHLEEFRNEGSVHENDLYPIELYITAAYLDKQTPHPLCIQACEQKAHKVSLKMTSFEEAETLRKSKVDEAQRLTREEKAAMEAERLSKARELGLPDNTPSSAVRLAIEGASPETAKSSSSWCQRIDDGDHREIYSEVQSKFENTHQWRDMSSKNRKPEYLRRATGFPIDNECWLRAGWFSLLNQLPSPEYTTGKMNAMFGERWTEHEYLRLLPILIKAYRENPQQFCFHEEDRNKGLNNVGIYFRSGTPSVQVLQELGYAEDRGRLSTFDTESHMKFAASYILPAFRKERPLICLRADELRMSMGLQSSDTALLLHRAFGLECLVLEFSTEGGVTAQVSSQHGSAVDEYMRQFEAKRNTAPEFKKAELNRLIDYFADRPILILRQDHFMVQMPKGARYDPYVANVVSNPPALPMDISTDSSTDDGAEESKAETSMELTLEIPLQANSEGFYTPLETSPVSSEGFSMFDSPPALSPRAEELSRAECGFASEVSSSPDGFKLNRISTETRKEPWVGNAPKNRNQLRPLLLPLLDENEHNQDRSIFCYTSPLGMRSPELSVQPPISALIRDLLWVGEDGVFGDFELTGIELVRKGTSSNECKHYEVNFRKKYGLDKGKLITVNLTESAPDFSNRYLTANQLMTNLEQLAENSDTPQDVMLSARGLTRAPALTVAQQIQEFIQRNPDASHGQVNTQLQRMIEAVKEGRGVKCLSKTEQTDALYELAAKLFRERQAAS